MTATIEALATALDIRVHMLMDSAYYGRTNPRLDRSDLEKYTDFSF
jgi:hypothetical protein